MKQQLIDFLGDNVGDYCDRILENSKGIYVYGFCGFLTMPALSSLIEFAKRHKCHYYVSSYRDEVFFRIYKS